MIIMRLPEYIKQQSDPIMLESMKPIEIYIWHAERLSIWSDRNIRTAMNHVTGLNSFIRVVKEAKEQKQRKVTCPSNKRLSKLDVLVVAAHQEQGLQVCSSAVVVSNGKMFLGGKMGFYTSG